MSFTRQDEVRPDDQYYWVTQNEDGSYSATPKELEDREEVDQDGNPRFVQTYDPITESMVDTTERLVHKGLKSTHIAQVKNNANVTLSHTDWVVIRKAERNIEIPTDVAQLRSDIINWSNTTEAAITACTTVEELKLINLGVSI